MPTDPASSSKPCMVEGELTLPDGQRFHFVGATEEIVESAAASLDAAYAYSSNAAEQPSSGEVAAPADIPGTCRAASEALLDALGPMDPLDALSLLL